MQTAILVIQSLLAIVIILLILVQSKGKGFSRSLSGGSFTRRGLEQIVYRFTFVAVGAFILVSILQLAL